MKKKTFAVIGLGQFGLAIVNELVNNNKDVIAIDTNEEVVEKVSKILHTAFIADSTDEVALKELGINEVDSAIVAYGSKIEASILTTVVLKEMGVPHIIVRVDDDYYIPIMKKLGATEVITPQKAAGIALANRIGIDEYKDFYKLDNKHSIVSLVIGEEFKPTLLKNLNHTGDYRINVVLVTRSGESFVPGGNDEIKPNDILYIVGTTKDINNFKNIINKK